MSTSAFFPVEEHLKAHLLHLKAAGRSPATIAARREVVKRARWEVGVPLAEATTQQLAEWLAWPTWSKSTRHIYRYHLRGFLSWQLEAGLAAADPSVRLAEVRLPRRMPRPVPDQVLAEILGKARDPYRLYILLATYAGLRCAEITLLDRDDITEDAITVQGKGDKVRLVETHPEIWRAVVAMPSGPIAHHVRRAPVLPERIGHVMSRTCANYLTRLGYRGVSMHRFRHTFATRMLRSKEHGGAGANIRVVQDLLGHASIASTQIYTQVTSEERRLAVNALPALPAVA